MTGFEFLFTFAGLLLGLAVAAVATGFADMWRVRDTMTIGLATPLLGIYILLAAAGAWVSLWGAREFLTMGPGELLRSVSMAMPYIFVAQAMFPFQHDKWTSLEDYYLRHHRVLLAVLIIPSGVSFLYNLAVGYQPHIFDVLGYGVPLLVPAVLIVWSRPTVQWLGLAVLSLNALLLMFV